MIYLLDTHTFLWALFDKKKLSSTALEIMQDGSNEGFVSVISFWEISLKYSLGKISFENVLPDDLPEYAEKAGFSILDIALSNAASFYKLPRSIYKDPFDRFIIWQAIQNEMALLSSDTGLREYRHFGLRVEW